MDTYTGKINEFVNWTSGVNELTNAKISGVDDEHPISGQSIRELIQSHLKAPFCTFKDEKEGQIKFFSSQEAIDKWKLYTNYSGDSESQVDPEKAESLVIYSMDLPATYKITGLENFRGKRYIIEGNSTSENAKLDINLGLEDTLANPADDTFSVSYKITDNSGQVRYKNTDQIDSGQHVIKEIYQFLRSGDNTVDIEVSANNHAAKATCTLHIFLVTFTITSSFSGHYRPVTLNQPIIFSVYEHKSITNLSAKVTITIDGEIAKKQGENNANAVWTDTLYNANPKVDVSITNNLGINQKHTMLITAEMEDSEMGNKFYSNTLVYEFEVAPPLDNGVLRYVNLAASIPSGLYTDVEGIAMLKGTQYLSTTINWGYNTDSSSLFQELNVEWYIRTGSQGQYLYKHIANIRGIKDLEPNPLTFIPESPLFFDTDHSYLVARLDINGTLTDISAYPIEIAESSMTVNELTGYSLKLSAYGKTNESDDKDQWIDSANGITTTFSSGVTFDDTNGWNDHSLLLKGQNSYAVINYCPFPSKVDNNSYLISSSGATFEIDFKPEYVANKDDVLICIGTKSNDKPHIEITTNSAAYVVGGSPVVKTNFKSGERIKLAFVLNTSLPNDGNAAGLVYIINNGILERAAARGSSNPVDDTGVITLGGTNSSVKIYSIRAYRTAISPRQELDNYMFDNASDLELLSRNDVYGGGTSVTYLGMSGKQDIIVIEGDMTNILANASTKQNATVDVRRESNIDPDRNFTIHNCRIRNHGQSTLSYPITSIKVWFNKSALLNAQGVELTPEFNCQSQSYLELNKNRYIMKAGAIPANKFVLLANYADSSGTHNGSLLRMIQDTWYNASIYGEYKLRTAPLLFASGAKVTHNNQAIYEDGTWEEGVYNIPSDATDKNGNSIYKADYVGLTWPEIANSEFPYKIRNAADSFPCVVFYRDTSTQDTNLKLLGLYVFMDDKKSDYVYGERSIYYTDDSSDPFCLKTSNSKKDKAANKVWDNNKVLLIEVVHPNSPLTSYITTQIANKYVLDEETDTLVAAPDSVIKPFNAPTEVDSNGNPTEFLWEQHFELIYPDKEDIKDENGNFDSIKFQSTVKPFEDFIRWITGISSLSGDGRSKLGSTGAQKYVTQDELDAFIATAHDHLDLYKLAAYYIFFLRFGLVDSVERNAQLKTYDGQHWHYEPWDMDVALGCANNGVIAYDPPLTRDSTNVGGSYVFSGRTSMQSNVLWDCLECWDEWANVIVPKVAAALYNAGLTYDNAVKMFDKEYQEKWSETLYNESGQYKYIEATDDPRYRLYLNGARTTHRHWWLSKSMNYYDAKWECGDFTKYNIVAIINKLQTLAGTSIVKIYPTDDTFFKIVYGAEGDENPIGGGLKPASVNAGQEAQFDIPNELADKNPMKIFGANSIMRIDMGGILNSDTSTNTTSYSSVDFSRTYDPVLGAQLKEINLGAPCGIYNNPNATQYSSFLTRGQNSIVGRYKDPQTEETYDALLNLETLDVIGWWSSEANSGTWLSNLMTGRKNISTLYAMGCGMATEFATSQEGNNFVDLRLPSDNMISLTFTNSSWLNISFWSTTITPGNNNHATYNKLPRIPATIKSVYLKGSTARNECSLDLVLDWIDAIEDDLRQTNPSFTEEDLYNKLSEYTLVADQIHWGTGERKLYYKDVKRLAHFGKDTSLQYSLKGYLLMTPEVGQSFTSSELTYLSLNNMFGDNVFNIGTTNTNLVIDYSNSEIIVTISGSDVQVINNVATIHEPNTARLTANKFSLTTGVVNNQIVDNDLNNPTRAQNLTEGKYIWGFVDSDQAADGTMTGTKRYARLERGAEDGLIRLKTEEGDGHDYTVYIRVVYGSGGTALRTTIQVNIIGVTYPTGFKWDISGDANIRMFEYPSDNSYALVRDLFGTNSADPWYDHPDVYVFGNSTQKNEFALVPNEPKTNINTGEILWTANPDNIEIEYNLMEANQPLSGIGYVSANSFINDAEFRLNGDDGSYIKAVGGATNGGICVKKDELDLPNQPVLFKLTARYKIGGFERQSKFIYIMVINDPDVIVAGNSSSSLSKVLWGTYANLYSGYSAESYLNMYKTDLLSLYGTINFSTETSISTVDYALNQSVLQFLPYVTEFNFSGCTLLLSINFTNCTHLVTLNLSGCTGLQGSVDLTHCINLESLNTTNCNVGIILPTGSKITNLALGSPRAININSALTLGNNDTLVSATSGSNLEYIELKNINSTYKKTFTVFDKIYVGVTSINRPQSVHLDILLAAEDYSLDKEEVSSQVIEKLYDLAYSGSLESLNTIKGIIHANKAYRDSVNYLNTNCPNLQVFADSDYVRINDPVLSQYLIAFALLHVLNADGIGITTSELNNQNMGSALNSMPELTRNQVTSLNDFLHFTTLSKSEQYITSTFPNATSITFPQREFRCHESIVKENPQLSSINYNNAVFIYDNNAYTNELCVIRKNNTIQNWDPSLIPSAQTSFDHVRLFLSWSLLEKVIFPSGVTHTFEIFLDCLNLQYIEFPETIVSLGDGFDFSKRTYGTPTARTMVILASNPPQWYGFDASKIGQSNSSGRGCGYDSLDKVTIYVPDASLNAYLNVTTPGSMWTCPFILTGDANGNGNIPRIKALSTLSPSDLAKGSDDLRTFWNSHYGTQSNG